MVNFINLIARSFLVNLWGKSVNEKLIIFESDDWGSVRTTKKEDFNLFHRVAYGNPYLELDTLASSDDLSELFKVLYSFRDKVGSHPVFTFNTVVGNPDFEEIAERNFDEYIYEPFTDTLKHYYPEQNVFSLWEEGMESGLIQPQFHGREHVNVPLWLQSLKGGDSELLRLFQLGSWSTRSGKVFGSEVKLQASLDYAPDIHTVYQKSFVEEGLDLFKKIFGFPALTMIANNYTWSPNIHEYIVMAGVKMMQSMKYQVLPYSGNDRHTLQRRYFGQEVDGLLFNIRNCFFEPSLYSSGFQNVTNALKQIEMAFRFNRPAVISSHRLNYIGVHDEANRRKNLELLKSLLEGILEKWPGVKFISSDKLIEFM